MNTVITKRQRKILENNIKVMKENDDYNFTEIDKLLEYFLSFPIGILKNGRTIKEICDDKGIDYENDHKQVLKERTNVCNFVLTMLSDGFPFAGIKEKGQLKKYGWIGTENEHKLVKEDKIKGLIKQVRAKTFILDDNSQFKQNAEKFIESCSEQLELDFFSWFYRRLKYTGIF